MNVYDGIHWNIYEILPYQRRFNLINSERTLGKTYTTQMYVLDKCIAKKKEFVYIVRTQDEKKKKVFEDAFAKVLQKEFIDYEFEIDTDTMYLCEKITLENEEVKVKQVLGHCIALSEALKIKRKSFPNVIFGIFDEYMLEESLEKSYVTGWNEPNLFLSIYHTIDRDEDRVIFFMLGNNTKFYNPYHLHKAFNVKLCELGGLWKSKNVLFQRPVASEALKAYKESSKFSQMIEGTDYGNFANEGQYIYDRDSLIAVPNGNTRYMFTLLYNSFECGVRLSNAQGLIYITDKPDKSCKLKYALTLNDHTENTMLTRTKSYSHLNWLSKNFKLGNVRYTSPSVKAIMEPAIYLIL